MDRVTRVLTLYQAEWCPYSSSVRERLTELGLDFTARQVAPRPEQRTELEQRAGTNEIPILETEDGEFHAGTRAIFGYLNTLEVGPHAAAHRERYVEHREARETDVTGQMLEPAAPVEQAAG